MGHVILPTGDSVYVEEMPGSVNLNRLFDDIACDDYTDMYRLHCMKALQRVGQFNPIRRDVIKEVHRRMAGDGIVVRAAKMKLLQDLSKNFNLE